MRGGLAAGAAGIRLDGRGQVGLTEEEAAGRRGARVAYLPMSEVDRRSPPAPPTASSS